MKSRAKLLLVGALRSGDYKQGKGCLKAVDKNGVTRHCCLGVLTEMYIQEVKPERGFSHNPTRKLYGSKAFSFGTHATYMMPVRPVLEWAGLKRSEAATLVQMNDDGKSFKAIANYIANNL